MWLNPFYTSPQADGGYDVADYRDVDPRFGTLADFDDLVAAAHARDVRVIVDLVPNHTSDRHPWFQEALASAPGSASAPALRLSRRAWTRRRRTSEQLAQRLRRVGVDTHHDGRRPTGEWYLHLFDTSQPDLNWTNDDVRAEFESILRFWLDRGVDGFRIDVAHGLAKDPAFTDLAGAYLRPDGRAPRPPALGPRGGARHLSVVARGSSTGTGRARSSSVRCRCTSSTGSLATCGPTSCRRRSTSSSSSPRSTRRRCVR